MDDPKFREPNFPKNYDSSRKPLPKDSPAKPVPAHTEVKSVNGLPASTGPKPLKGWDK